MTRVLRRAGWLAIVGWCMTVASCSLFRTPLPANSATGRHAAAPARLTQLNFGRDAIFALCVPPACPTRTPKSLASEAPSQPTNAAWRVPAEPVASAPAPPVAATQAEFSRTLAVQFALASTKLSPAARSRLDAAMGDLRRARGITIIGRTDSTGHLAFNQELAVARALAVRDHLRRTYPALPATLTVQARGSCCFIASNDTLVGRARNRRVEVVYQMSEADRP